MKNFRRVLRTRLFIRIRSSVFNIGRSCYGGPHRHRGRCEAADGEILVFDLLEGSKSERFDSILERLRFYRSRGALVARALHERSVRFILIGVSGANYYAPGGQAAFLTEDRDLLLPPDPENLLRTWAACEAAGLSLWAGGEPLDSPRDKWLAGRIVERRATTRASGRHVDIDLMLVMKGFEFETVWNDRREFSVEGVRLPVARLVDIIRSKEAAGRDKDRLFLAAHRDALEQLLKRDTPEGGGPD